MRLAMWAAFLAACVDGTTDTKTDTDTDTDTPVDTDTDTDTDTTADTSSCVPTFDDDCKTYGDKGQRCAELSTTGAGDVSVKGKATSFDATETIRLLSLDTKKNVCEISYDLVQGKDRSKECPGNCAWAAEFETANVQVVTNEDSACDGVLAAMEICDVKELEGRTFVRGYDPDWEGHAQVIWTVNDGKWEVISFSKLNTKKDVLDYVWFDGIYPY